MTEINRSEAPELDAERITQLIMDISDDRLDSYLDGLLRSSGSALRHYTLPGARAKMRAVLRGILDDAAVLILCGDEHFNNNGK